MKKNATISLSDPSRSRFSQKKSGRVAFERMPLTTLSKTIPTTDQSTRRPLRVAVVPLVFEFYDYTVPYLRGKLLQVFQKMAEELTIEDLELLPCELVSTLSHMERLCSDLAAQQIDLIVVAHLSYAPSGQIASALLKVPDVPLLLWPLQPMEEMVPEDFDGQGVLLNHSVHGTMDLANVLRRADRPYGVIHGHWREAKFQREFLQWAQVGCMLQTLRNSKPLVIGERFPDMLDLRLDEEPFMKKLGIQPRQISFDEFADEAAQVKDEAVTELFESYKQRFEIDDALPEPVILRGARNELVLRRLLDKYESRAVAVNFLAACKEPRLADALHVAVSNLMTEGVGYGAETDWETASLVTAMQAAFGIERAGFSEVFSGDYGNDRLLLRHWGEGNLHQTDQKPKLVRSALNHIETQTVFPTFSFQYRPGRYALINLSATKDGEGQIVHLPGQVDETPLPKCGGVRSLFKPDCADIRDALNQYTTLGASHHVAFVEGDLTSFIEKLAQQTEWKCHTIK